MIIQRLHCLACGEPVEWTRRLSNDPGVFVVTDELVHDTPGDAACRWFMQTLRDDLERALQGMLDRARTYLP